MNVEREVRCSPGSVGELERYSPKTFTSAMLR